MRLHEAAPKLIIQERVGDKNESFVILAGSRTYKGRARPRPVTPRSSSEWTPTSMAGVTVLADEIRSNTDLFGPGPRLPQPQVADLPIGFSRFPPTLAKPPLDASRLKLLLQEVDLGAERLALLVHGAVAVDFGHEAPVVNGELVKLAAEGGIGSPAPSKGGNEPCR